MRPELAAVLEAYRHDITSEEELISDILAVLAVTGTARKRTIQELSQVLARHTMRMDERDFRRPAEELGRYELQETFKQ